MTNSTVSFDGLPSKLVLCLALSERARRIRTDRLARYRPYPRQEAFHADGAWARERLLLAGNQTGKTWCAAFEAAIHLTGRYPQWWRGRRWDRPIRAWAAGVTAESTRDNPQRVLLGPPALRQEWGTGAIPKRCLEDVALGRGIADAADALVVRHASGGRSTLAFKSYEKGREKWQGETLDLVWFDEEPPLEIYTEGLTRTNATGGMGLLTFTPLQGLSELVRLFLQAEEPESEAAAPSSA